MLLATLLVLCNLQPHAQHPKQGPKQHENARPKIEIEDRIEVKAEAKTKAEESSTLKPSAKVTSRKAIVKPRSRPVTESNRSRNALAGFELVVPAIKKAVQPEMRGNSGNAYLPPDQRKPESARSAGSPVIRSNFSAMPFAWFLSIPNLNKLGPSKDAIKKMQGISGEMANVNDDKSERNRTMELATNEKIPRTLSPAQSNGMESGKKDSVGKHDFAAIFAGVRADLPHSTARESDPEQGQHPQEEKYEKKVAEKSSTEAPGGAAMVSLPPDVSHLRGEVLDVQAILPAADLEKIIAAARTQLLPGGAREITLDLSHSVLEGMRIKLTAMPSGRLAINFIAPSEAVRAIVEAHSHELGELLRARGINLASLKSSLGEHAGSHDDPREQGKFGRPDHPADLLGKLRKRKGTSV